MTGYVRNISGFPTVASFLIAGLGDDGHVISRDAGCIAGDVPSGMHAYFEAPGGVAAPAYHARMRSFEIITDKVQRRSSTARFLLAPGSMILLPRDTDIFAVTGLVVTVMLIGFWRLLA